MLMQWIKNKVIQWVREDWELTRSQIKGRAINEAIGVDREESELDAAPKVRVSLLPALNGRILQVASVVKNQHGQHWQNDLFIVAESQKLSEAIALVMTMKGLEE